jgi:hypothetical protein
MVTAALALAGCSGYRDGDRVARDIAEQQAALLNDKLGHRTGIREAEYIAATEIARQEPDTEDAGPTVRLTPLAWSGQTFGSEQATIDVRFVVTVAEQPATSFGGLRGISAGQATRCYRYVFQRYRYTEHHEIDCPATTAIPAPPTAAPIPRMPDDARERLAAVLRTATPDTLAAAVRAAFPEKYIVIDTATYKGALVAAVGVPAERDCLLLVRTNSGDIESPGYDPVQLQPGELGCSTNLFISPPG